MQYTTLPTTDIRVSRACLGTMSFGAHVDEDTASAVMDAALDRGINFFDTAEMYSVPVAKETIGLTEEIIGRWMQARGNRDHIVLATKVAGPKRNPSAIHIRDGNPRLDRANIRAAVEGSLRRLQTDWIDLYQLHWPDRNAPIFGQRAYQPQASEERTPIAETLAVLGELVAEGKVRAIGLSNETPWGAMGFLRLAKELNLPRAVTTQNNYSLLTRTYEIAMAEVSHREHLGLLAYSPLGYGVLGGRYLDGARPADGRFTKYPEFNPRYRTPRLEAITKQYLAIAQAANLTLPQLALAFVARQPFVTSTIIGPSNVAQLAEDADAVDLELSAETLAAIEAVHESCPNPCA